MGGVVAGFYCIIKKKYCLALPPFGQVGAQRILLVVDTYSWTCSIGPAIITCILVAYRSRSLTPSSQCYLGFVNAPFVKKEKLMFASRQTRYLGLPFGQIWFYIDFTNFYISYHVNKHQPPPLPDNFLRWQSVWNQHGRVFSAVIDNLHLDFFLI